MKRFIQQSGTCPDEEMKMIGHQYPGKGFKVIKQIAIIKLEKIVIISTFPKQIRFVSGLVINVIETPRLKIFMIIHRQSVFSLKR